MNAEDFARGEPVIDRWLELHDSTIEGVDSSPDAVELCLQGYVHQWESTSDGRVGTGWIVPLVIRVSEVSVVPSITVPASISDGSVAIESGRLDNLLPLPSDVAGNVRLAIGLTDGTRFELAGTRLQVLASQGEPRFVEPLDESLDPRARSV